MITSDFVNYYGTGDDVKIFAKDGVLNFYGGDDQFLAMMMPGLPNCKLI